MPPQRLPSSNIMASLVDNFVPSSTYNTLPLISQVAGVPKEHSQDLQDLRELLNKHNVPKGVSVRLIHKHFDAKSWFLTGFPSQDMASFRL